MRINEPHPRNRPPFRFNRLLANANPARNQTGGIRGRQMARGNILTAVIVRSLHFSMKAKPTPAGRRHPMRPRTRDARVGIDGNPAGWSLEAMRTTDVPPAIAFFYAIPTDFRSILRRRVWKLERDARLMSPITIFYVYMYS